MVVINILFLIVAIGIVGGGAYLFVNYEGFEDIVSEDALIYGVIAGGVLFVLALLGLYGTVFNNKIVLSAYMILIVIMVASQVIVAILGLQYIGELQALGGNSTLSSKTEQVINDFVLRSYETCCFKQDGQAGEENYCPTGQCTKLLGCDDPTCASDPGVCSSGICVSGTSGTIEPVDIGVCSGLEAFGLVGPANSSAQLCGGGDPQLFLNQFLDRVAEDFNLAGYFLIGLGALELILIFISVYLVFGKRSDFDGRERYAVAVGEALDPFEVDMDSVRDSISIAPPPMPNSGRSRGRSNVGSAGSFGGRSSFDGAFDSVRSSARSSVRSSIDRRTMQSNPSAIDDVL